MTAGQRLISVGIAALVTVLIRALPFWLFTDKRKPPAFVLWLGERLPRAVMAMLVVYCLKDALLGEGPGLLPALAGVAVTAALHLWKKQMILSIAGGTICYMLLIQFVF